MISNEIYKFFSDYIFENTGIFYKESDYYRLEQRLKEIRELLEADSIEEVYSLYKSNITPDMKAVLINISTNNETFFFRDQKVFDSLPEVYQMLSEHYKSGKIQIWSAACSTGQEPLSILMQTDAKLDDTACSRLNISATDISETALNKAKAGIYTGLDVQRGLPITTLIKYFDQLEDETWKVNDKLLNKIEYGNFNLFDGLYLSNHYHIIFCRNVLIYQNKENKQKILNKLFDSLRPNGILYLGNGESLIGMKTDFKRNEFGGKVVYQKIID